MRKFKYIVLIVALLFAGLLAYALFVPWYPQTRGKSVRILAAAKTTNELRKAVGSLGLFIPLTNNAWIAIRYRDSHSGGIRSCAVARDSGGGWFESDRHFCGSLAYWPELKASVEVEEYVRRTKPEFITNRVSLADSDNGSFPTFRDMQAIESAPDLESARRALRKIGFTELRK